MSTLSMQRPEICRCKFVVYCGLCSFERSS